MTADIGLRRLTSQQIAPPAHPHPAEVVRALGAVQAQDYLGALWALGLRTNAATEESVERAFAERALVRTWPMRGTLHFVAPGDARWMLDLLAPRAAQRSQGRLRQLDIDAQVVAASAAVLARALEGGRRLTRAAVYETLERAGIATTGQRGIHILGQLAHQQVICLGPRAGKQHTFVLFDEWAPGAQSLPRDEALAELARRYFTGHGPATVRDMVWWSGLTVQDAKAGLAAAAPLLAREMIGGQEYYAAPDVPPAPADPREVHLLPPFDEFLVGYRDRSASLDVQHSGLVAPGANGIFNPIVVIGGRVVGTWKRTFVKDRVEIALRPFVAWEGEHVGALTAAAERYGQFVGRPARVTFEG